MPRSIEPGEALAVDGQLQVTPDPRNPTAQRLTIDGHDLAELAAECFGNGAKTGVAVRVVIERTFWSEGK